MKYALLGLLYTLGVYFYTLFNFAAHGWQYFLVFFVLILLVYFNNQNPTVNYVFAGCCGLYQDSLSVYFGVYTFIFITIVFLMSVLQSTVLTHRNFLSVVTLTVTAFIFYWLFFWLINFVFDRSVYLFSEQSWGDILKYGFMSIFAILLIHLLYFNLWSKKREKIQSI